MDWYSAFAHSVIVTSKGPQTRLETQKPNKILTSITLLVTKNNNNSSEPIFEILYHNHNNTSPKQQQVIAHYLSFHIIYFRSS